MITDPAFYAVATFAIILNGISKSGFAGAFAARAVESGQFVHRIGVVSGHAGRHSHWSLAVP